MKANISVSVDMEFLEKLYQLFPQLNRSQIVNEGLIQLLYSEGYTVTENTKRWQIEKQIGG